MLRLVGREKVLYGVNIIAISFSRASFPFRCSPTWRSGCSLLSANIARVLSFATVPWRSIP